MGGGAKGIVFWLWNHRTLGREGGEWALVGLDGLPTDRLTAVKDLPARPRCRSWQQAVPQRSKVAILYSRPTLLLGDMEGQNLGHQKDSLLSLWGCYRALLESHVPADFIDVDELKAGRRADYDVLYLPHCYALDAQTGAAVRQFAEAGGTVWADGLLGWKDPYGDMAPAAPLEMTSLFGFELHDIDATEKPFSLAGGADNGGELWRDTPDPARCRGDASRCRRHAAGDHASLRQGRCPLLCHGTFAGILSPSASRGAAAGSRRPPWGATPTLAVEMTGGSEQVVFRGMVSPSRRVAVLSNWGPRARQRCPLQAISSVWWKRSAVPS